MYLNSLLPILQKIVDVYARQIPIIIGLACLFAAFTVFKSHVSSPGKVWWRNPGLATDVTYALIHGVAGPLLQVAGADRSSTSLSPPTVMTPAEVERVLCSRRRPAERTSLLGAGRRSTHRRGPAALLDPPDLPRPSDVAIPCHPSLCGRGRLDDELPLPSDQSDAAASARDRHHADGGNFA